MATIQYRRGTTSQWTTANPVLAAGEPGRDTTLDRSKTGDGTTAWTALPWDALNKAELDTHYAPVFQPLTAYATGATVLLPAPVSAIGKRTAAGTSRAAFDATEQALWTVAAASVAYPIQIDGTTGVPYITVP